MEVFKIKEQEFRVKDIPVTKQLALFKLYGVTNLYDVDLETSQKFYDVILENIEYKYKDKWLSVKEPGVEECIYKDMNLLLGLELQKKFIEYVFDPVFQQDNA